jgi:hypothetical protein
MTIFVNNPIIKANNTEIFQVVTLQLARKTKQSAGIVAFNRSDVVGGVNSKMTFSTFKMVKILARYG